MGSGAFRHVTKAKSGVRRMRETDAPTRLVLVTETVVLTLRPKKRAK